MMIDKDTLRKAKQALKEMPTKTKSHMSRKEFISALTKEIQSMREAGFTYSDICTELNKTLPEDAQMAASTLASYARKARAEAGLAPLKKWTRRTQSESESSSENGSRSSPHVDTKANKKTATQARTNVSARTSTAADFRDGDEL